MIGQLIAERYQVLEVLGSGKMANTYLTLDLHAGDRTKCVIKQFVPSHPDLKLQAAQRQLFAEEAASLKTLGAHDQIPQHLNNFEYQAEHYLIQEFIEGHPLTAELFCRARWQEPQVIQFLQEMLSVLAYVHGQGVIHRDVKPSNIMRRQSDNQLVLIDFGAAQKIMTRHSLFSRESRANFIVGTLGYMPIEQAQGKAQPNSDVYSLGMIAIQALTGQLPRQLQEDKKGEWLWRSHATVSDELAAVLAKMVRCRSGQRFQSATEALAAVQALGSVPSRVREDASVGAKRLSKAPRESGLSGESKDSCLHNVPVFEPAIDIERSALAAIDGGSVCDLAPTEVMPSNQKSRTSSYDLKAIAPSLHQAILRRPIHALVGAAAIVLATALPSIADRVHMYASASTEPNQAVFNPQDLRHVGRYDDHYEH